MTTRRRPRPSARLPAALAALALVGLVLAGCGGSDKASAVAGAAGTDGRAAQAFPASTVAFADANIDENSDAWKRLLALGARFPSWPKLVAEFNKSGQRGHRRRPDAHAGALAGSAPRSRSACSTCRPTARTRWCSASPR